MTGAAPPDGEPPLPQRPPRLPQSGAAWAIDGAVGVSCVVLLVGFVATVARADSMEVAGELAGTLSLPVLGAGTFAMRMRRARKWGWASLGVVAVLAAFGLAGIPPAIGRIAGARATPEHVLSAADRRALERVEHDGAVWLVQRSVGFELLDPGARFVPDASATDMLTQHAGDSMRPYMHAYARVERDRGALNIVVLARQGIDDHVEEVFRGVADGFRRQVGSSFREERSGSGLGARMDLHGEVHGVAARARVLLVRRPAGGRSVTLTVSIVPADDPALSRTLESVRALQRRE